MEWVSGLRTGVLAPPKPPGVAPPDSNRILPVVDEFPPDSNLILHRLTLPVTTGDGDLLRMDKGVTRVEGGFEGVPVSGLKSSNVVLRKGLFRFGSLYGLTFDLLITLIHLSYYCIDVDRT